MDSIEPKTEASLILKWVLGESEISPVDMVSKKKLKNKQRFLHLKGMDQFYRKKYSKDPEAWTKDPYPKNPSI